jgi:hypothetical protein
MDDTKKNRSRRTPVPEGTSGAPCWRSTGGGPPPAGELVEPDRQEDRPREEHPAADPHPLHSYPRWPVATTQPSFELI